MEGIFSGGLTSSFLWGSPIKAAIHYHLAMTSAPTGRRVVLAGVGKFTIKLSCTVPDDTISTPPSKSAIYRRKLTSGQTLRRRRLCREYQHFPWRRLPIKFSHECFVHNGTGNALNSVFVVHMRSEISR